MLGYTMLVCNILSAHCVQQRREKPRYTPKDSGRMSAAFRFTNQLASRLTKEGHAANTRSFSHGLPMKPLGGKET